MKIFKCENGSLKEKEYICDTLKIITDEKQIISFVGAGGKTSLIYALAKEFDKLGKKVIVTTTTHMFMPENNVVLTENINDIKNMLTKTNIVTVGTQSEVLISSSDNSCLNSREKIKGVSLDLASKLIDIADIVLVEADGSKRLPLKVPANHEPVIMEGTTMVIGVAGLDALGKSISEICHRSNLAAELLDVDENHIITPQDMAVILSSKKGQRKNVNCDYRVIINKADNINQIDEAKNIASELHNLGVYECAITTFR